MFATACLDAIMKINNMKSKPFILWPIKSRLFGVWHCLMVLASPFVQLSPATAQPSMPPDNAKLDVSTILFVNYLDSAVKYTTVQKAVFPLDSLSNVKITQSIPKSYYREVPPAIVGRYICLKFFLKNNSDSAKEVYFFPGLYFRNIELLKADPYLGKPLHARSDTKGPDTTNQSGYQLIRLTAGETALFFVRLEMANTTINNLSPRIIAKDFLPYFRSGLISRKSNINIVNYISAGILLMMVFYSVAVYLQNFNREFIYYAVYAGCTGLLLFLKSFLFGMTNAFNYFFEGYLDFIIMMTGYSFYLLFFRKFLDTKRRHPFLDKTFTTTNWLILLSVSLFTVCYFVGNNFIILNSIENITKQILVVLSILFIYYGIRKKDPLMNYLVAGQSFLTLFSVISLLLIITPIKISQKPGNILNDSLLYYQMGLVLELIFFMSGLSYKNKNDLTERVKERERFKLDNERKEFEKQVAILEAKQEERNRISADMHDELGSGVTAIRLMSEIVMAKMKDQTFPEIEKISHSANELLNKMNTIIWTMVSSNDTVESLVAYIRAYAVEFFENTQIDCVFHMPAIISSKELSGEKRRNIFLSVKESLHNVLKHSHATEVTINVSVGETLIIEIFDNGVGINLDKPRKFGNGLQNMKKRIESIDGRFAIANHQGTKTVFELDL